MGDKKENKKVLLIDGEPEFAKKLQKALEAKSYEVVACSTKEEGQGTMDIEPDVIILGTIAPAGQAFSMHQWLKGHSRYKDIPLVVIDASLDERQEKGWRIFEGMQLEAEEYAVKPVEPEDILLRVHNLLEESTRLIKVLVVDDHTMVRDGICSVLTLQNDIEVVGEAVDGQEGVEKALKLMPHVVLMDISMPVMSGLEATKEINKKSSQMKVLILTQYDSEENMFVAKEAGAQGFIPKRAASSELLSGIRAVAAGRYFPAAFAYVSANWKQGSIPPQKNNRH
jgi:DNA-binding NarL/FixJ family response regulator